MVKRILNKKQFKFSCLKVCDFHNNNNKILRPDETVGKCLLFDTQKRIYFNKQINYLKSVQVLSIKT